MVLGVAPLLIELFKQVVDAYKLFLEGQNLEKSMIHFTVRLEIEERRLLQWGQSSGFYKDASDNSQASAFATNICLFHEKHLLPLIEKVLHCIFDVLTDVELLRMKYGLEVESNSNTALIERAPIKTASDQIGGHGQSEDTNVGKRKATDKFPVMKKAKTAINRFRWAVKDKERFERILADLRYYNDSLYELHRPNISATILRDALISLIHSADSELLHALRSLETSGPRSSASSKSDTSFYSSVPLSASLALEIRTRSSGALKTIPSMEPDFDSFNMEGGLRWESWHTPSSSQIEGTNIVLEETMDWDFQSAGFQEELQKTQKVASLLTLANSEPAFRTMEFLGVVRHHDENHEHCRIALAYKFPPWADLIKGPKSLHSIITSGLHGSSRRPALDDRLELVRSLLRAAFHLHSSGWMHKRISPRYIAFFQSREVEATEVDDWIQRPYLHGFRPSSITGSTQQRFDSELSQFDDFINESHVHPSYAFHKACASLPRHIPIDPSKTYHRFRHDYYSLGLIMLEIGFWTPLMRMNTINDTLMEAASPEQRDKRNSWNVSSKCFLSISPPSSSRPQRNAGSCYPKELQDCIRDLREAINEEQMQDMADLSVVDNGMKGANDSSTKSGHVRGGSLFWDVWVGTEIYLHALCRRNAIRLAESSLASTMGRRYQKVVLRCLKSDFDLPPSAKEAEWLKAFNWLAVSELETLCL